MISTRSCDAICTQANPSQDGRYYPVDGASEWHLGAGAMANDPRDAKLNNARLAFVKPQGSSKALRGYPARFPV